MKHVLIVYLHGIGDHLLAMPAIHAYKKHHPHTKITIMTVHNTSYIDLWKHSNDIIRTIFSSLTKNPRYGHPSFWLKDYWTLRRDIIKAKAQYNFDKVHFIIHYTLPAALYAKLPLKKYTTHKSILVAKKLGVHLPKHNYVFTISAAEKKWADAYFKQQHIKKKLVGLHLTGSSPNKSLSYNLAKPLIEKLHQQNYHVVIFNDPSSYKREKHHYTGKDITNFISTEILKTAAIVNTCQFLICVDSAISHLAGALHKPVFCIYFRNVWALNSAVLDTKARIYTFDPATFLTEATAFIHSKK